jgi:hypothetical protein
MSEKQEKIFYGVLVVFFISSLIAWLQVVDQPRSLQWWIFLVLMLGSFAVSIVAFFYNRLLSKWLSRKKLGIVKIIDNRKECEDLIRRGYSGTRNAKIFILRGMSDFVSENSLFESLSTDEKDSVILKQSPHGEIKVLICSPRSKFISAERYESITSAGKQKKKDPTDTSIDIETVERQLKRIGGSINLKYRFYRDGFLGKFYLFDDTGFVIFNDRITRLDQNSPAIQIKPVQTKAEGSNAVGILSIGLYSCLERYFDFLWEFQSTDHY